MPCYTGLASWHWLSCLVCWCWTRQRRGLASRSTEVPSFGFPRYLVPRPFTKSGSPSGNLAGDIRHWSSQFLPNSCGLLTVLWMTRTAGLGTLGGRAGLGTFGGRAGFFLWRGGSEALWLCDLYFLPSPLRRIILFSLHTLRFSAPVLHSWKFQYVWGVCHMDEVHPSSLLSSLSTHPRRQHLRASLAFPGKQHWPLPTSTGPPRPLIFQSGHFGRGATGRYGWLGWTTWGGGAGAGEDPKWTPAWQPP